MLPHRRPDWPEMSSDDAMSTIAFYSLGQAYLPQIRVGKQRASARKARASIDKGATQVLRDAARVRKRRDRRTSPRRRRARGHGICDGSVHDAQVQATPEFAWILRVFGRQKLLAIYNCESGLCSPCRRRLHRHRGENAKCMRVAMISSDAERTFDVLPLDSLQSRTFHRAGAGADHPAPLLKLLLPIRLDQLHLDRDADARGHAAASTARLQSRAQGYLEGCRR